MSFYNLQVPCRIGGFDVEAYHGTGLCTGLDEFGTTVAEESRLVAPVVDYGLAFPEDGFERDVLYEFNLGEYEVVTRDDESAVVDKVAEHVGFEDNADDLCAGIDIKVVLSGDGFGESAPAVAMTQRYATPTVGGTERSDGELEFGARVDGSPVVLVP